MSSEQTEEDVRGVDGNVSLVSGPKRLQLKAGQKIAVAGLVAAVFLSFIWIDHSLQKKVAQKQPELSVRPTLASFRPAPISLPPAPEPVAQTVRPPPPRDTTAADSPIFAFAGNQGGGAGARTASDNPVVPAISPASAENALSARLKPTVLEGSKASLLPHPDMLITKGTIIPCTLQTAISSELAGYVKCVLPEAVRSTTGKVVLLDRGTTIVGEIQMGLAQGQERLFILWDRAETPGHAVVSLASPGADEVGRTGVPGTVNTHFWQRFGNAIMLSIIQSSLQAGTAFAGNSGSGTGTYFNNFQSSGDQLATSTLQSSVNIPPTLEKNQGESVSIFVARDIDFSNVYKLSVVE